MRGTARPVMHVAVFGRDKIQEATGDSTEIAFVDQSYTDDKPAAASR